MYMCVYDLITTTTTIRQVSFTLFTSGLPSLKIKKNKKIKTLVE